MITTEIRRTSLLRILFLVSLDKSVLLLCWYLMSKLPQILILVCRKKGNFFQKNLIFYLLALYFIIGNIFVQSWLIWATFQTASHQKSLLLSSDLKKCSHRTLSKDAAICYFFFKLGVLINFPKFTRKLSVLESF